MYLRKAVISAMKKKALISLLLAVLFGSIAYLKPTEIKTGILKTENLITFDITRNYTIQYWNGEVEAVYIDPKIYDVDTILGNSEIDHCNVITFAGIDALDNGHTCQLSDTIEVWRFLNAIGY